MFPASGSLITPFPLCGNVQPHLRQMSNYQPYIAALQWCQSNETTLSCPALNLPMFEVCQVFFLPCSILQLFVPNACLVLQWSVSSLRARAVPPSGLLNSARERGRSLEVCWRKLIAANWCVGLMRGGMKSLLFSWGYTRKRPGVFFFFLQSFILSAHNGTGRICPRLRF